MSCDADIRTETRKDVLSVPIQSVLHEFLRKNLKVMKKMAKLQIQLWKEKKK